VANLGATEQMIIALPDIKKEEIDPARDEFMVLACDGIWNSMSSQEVVDFVRPLILDGEKLSAICEKVGFNLFSILKKKIIAAKMFKLML
jgi:protein phosphatase 1G